MTPDHILGLSVIAIAYGLTWYLLVISIRIVNRSGNRKSDDTDGGTA